MTTKYEICYQTDGYGIRKEVTDGFLESHYEYFGGYDFMGSVDWTETPEYMMDVVDAYQIKADLESADM